MLSNKHAMFLPFALMAMLKCHRIIVIRLKQPAGEWARKFKALPIKSKGILYLYVRYAPSSIYSCFIKLLGFFYTQDSNCEWLSTYFTFFIFILKQKFIFVKVHIFWEGHKILRNFHRRFVLCQIYGGDFAKCSGLLRIYKL